jgi:rhodanese-related sulfurtransferase
MTDAAFHSIAPQALFDLQRSGKPAEVIDVRRRAARRQQGADIPGGTWRDPAQVLGWKDQLEPGPLRIIACAHGHEISQGIAAMLRAMGHRAISLEGGFSAWRDAGLPVAGLPPGTRWVTRERPKIDRIACPWLITRFIDAEAEFLYVPADQVLAVAAAQNATPYDIPGVEFAHVGEACSFDAFLARYQLSDPALLRLATIVRGADTAKIDLAPQCAGLLAISLGLSALHADDQACLAAGMVVYDGLYAWCQSVHAEPPARMASPTA